MGLTDYRLWFIYFLICFAKHTIFKHIDKCNRMWIFLYIYSKAIKTTYWANVIIIIISEILQVDIELACPSLFYPDWGCWRLSLRCAEVNYRRALCWGRRMLWGHGWVTEEFLMSQSAVKYQDLDGKEGPDSLSAGFSLLGAQVQVGEKQTAFWGNA